MSYTPPPLWPCPRCGFYQPQSSMRCIQCGLQLTQEPPRADHSLRNVLVGLAALTVVIVVAGFALFQMLSSRGPTTPGATQPPRPQATFATLSERDWAQIVKSPDAHRGEGYVVYACVTQFDAATGPASFRANASWQNEQYSFAGDNAWFEGSASLLNDVVKDDELQMRVTVTGAYSYSTQIGGQTTVPAFQVVGIDLKERC
jgi:hypothetical protein